VRDRTEAGALSAIEAGTPGAAAEAGALGADRLLEALERLGVEVVFGLPGVHNLPIWKALAASPLRLVGVRHEQTAVYAADGYARATGQLGVAVVTTGPGAANTLGATGEAMASGSPVLVIATDIPTTLRREGVYRGVLHETRDQAAMFAPVTKGAATSAAAEAIAADVERAGALALAAPHGPVYLGLPTDLLSQPAAELAPAPAPPAPVPLDAEALATALALLDGARAPLIWAGGGALRAGAGAAVGELARRLAAPVVTTYGGRGLLAPDHPCAVCGPVHLPDVGALWDEADLVVAIGTDFDGMMTQNWTMPAPPRLLAINVDPEDAAKNYAPDVTLVGDARALTAALAERVPERAGLGELAARVDALAERVREAAARDDPQAARMLEIVREVLPPEAVVVADMCIAGYWLGGFHPVPLPRKLAYPVGWGTLGFAFPASLGSAAAGAGRAICFCGDGGFLFACGELATAAQERLPVTVVIADDGGYGMLRFDQRHAGDEPFGVDLQTPDFVALAQAFGVRAVRVDCFGDAFAAQLADSLSAQGPVVIVVDAALKPPPTTSPRWYRRHVPSPSPDREEQRP
jgi:thiamine pyrophosphate-dependent acetolactate synthase large subunit-like protein